MSTEGPLSDVKTGVEVVAALMKTAGDHPDVKEAGANLAKTALTITRTINVALLPLAAMNFGVEKAKKYFEEHFSNDLLSVASSIPAEEIIEPRASLVGPALQALAFAHDEPDLKAMYLNLMATSMASSKASLAHPAFVEIIRQLSPDEASVLRNLLQGEVPYAAVELRQRQVPVGHRVLLSHLISFTHTETGTPAELADHAAMVDNWTRLGLFEVEYDHIFLTDPNAYSWVKTRPEYLRLKAQCEAAGKAIDFGKGLIRRTAFGRQFAKAVGIEVEAAAL